MYLLRVIVGVYFIFLFFALMLGVVGSHKPSAVNRSSPPSIDVGIALGSVGIICLVGGCMSLKDRRLARGFGSKWPLVASVVTLFMFISFGVFYFVTRGLRVFLLEERVLGVLQILSALGVYAFWQRKGAPSPR